jgi:hypothetical protein
MMATLRRWFSDLWRSFLALFSFRTPEADLTRKNPPGRLARLWRVTWRGLALLFLLLFFVWNADFLWNVLWTRGYALSYPKAVIADDKPATMATSEGAACRRSSIVDVQVYLIDFLVNENAWISSMPQYKIGLLGLVSWEATPFFDNKAATQRGVLNALRRTGVELTDILGRVRGTSQADPDLQAARGLLQYDERTWWFNPFDKTRPFGPVQPSPSIYRSAIPLYQSFNDRLGRCQASFDARADNLLQFLERIAQDTGSTVDALAKRSQGKRYDPVTDTFVPGEGNDWGWFDPRADDLFMFALGQMYAYHGLLQAARLDFADVVDKRDLGPIWDLLERHVAEAAALSPTIVSNGREDGMIMPDHLAVMAQVILRARANLTELRDVLKR